MRSATNPDDTHPKSPAHLCHTPPDAAIPENEGTFPLQQDGRVRVIPRRPIVRAKRPIHGNDELRRGEKQRKGQLGRGTGVVVQVVHRDVWPLEQEGPSGRRKAGPRDDERMQSPTRGQVSRRGDARHQDLEIGAVWRSLPNGESYAGFKKSPQVGQDAWLRLTQQMD
jgi:hypothetical protein